MTTANPSERVLPAVGHLLRLRVRISLNGFRHAKLANKIGIVFLWLMVLGFAVFMYFISTFFLDLLRSPDLARYAGIDAQPMLQAVPVAIVSAMFLGIVLTSFGVLLQALYLAGDMDFLLSFPVPIRAVFIAKLVQAVIPNLGLVSLFGLPILFGLGSSGGYSFLYYPLVVLVIIAITLAGSGLSSLLVMLVARVFPARRAAEILGFLGATLGLTCSQWYNFSQGFGSGDFSDKQLGGLSDLLTRADTLWLPLNWAGRGLVDIGEGRWLTGIPLLLLTFGLCAATFGFSLATAERWYYSGWARVQVVTRKKKTTHAPRPESRLASGFSALAARLVSAPVRAIIGKDFLVLRRDLRNLSQLISPLILGVIYTLMMFRSGGEPPPGRGEAPDWFMDSFRAVLSFGSVGMSLFVGWMLLSRLAGMGLSMEGKNYWLLKVSPLRVRDLLLAKFLMAYLPTLALGLVFLVVITIGQGFSAGMFLYSLAMLLLSLAGMNGLMLGFGAAGANLEWDDPRKMNAGAYGCLGQFITMLYVPIVFILFVGPLWFAAFSKWPEIIGYLAGLFLGGAFSLAFAIIPPLLARKKVERLGET